MEEIEATGRATTYGETTQLGYVGRQEAGGWRVGIADAETPAQINWLAGDYASRAEAREGDAAIARDLAATLGATTTQQGESEGEGKSQSQSGGEDEAEGQFAGAGQGQEATEEHDKAEQRMLDEHQQAREQRENSEAIRRAGEGNTPSRPVGMSAGMSPGM